MSKTFESNDAEKVADLLRELLITSLATAGVAQQEIRKIIGCDMNRVSRIAKHIERKN